MPEEIDHQFTDEIVCPYCGYEHSDSWEMGDQGEIECEKCGKTFEYWVETQVHYTTKRKENEG